MIEAWRWREWRSWMKIATICCAFSSKKTTPKQLAGPEPNPYLQNKISVEEAKDLREILISTTDISELPAKLKE